MIHLSMQYSMTSSISSLVTYLIFVLSMHTTLHPEQVSMQADHVQHQQNKLLHPILKMQSVKPPVEAPTSYIFFYLNNSNLSIAFSSLSPPRLTYFNVLPRTSILTVSLKNVPALSSLSLLTKTIHSL